MDAIVIHPRYARKISDPLSHSTHATERHVFFVAVTDVPAGISLDPSPHATKTRWDVYKQVQASLLDQDCTPGTFHLKNRGITVVAREVHKIEENEYQLQFGPGHGIIDGAHTYRLILEAQQNRQLDLPKKQFVKIEVLTHVPDEWLEELATGLNTSIQGQSDSLEHLGDAVQWLKDELSSQRYYKTIAWSESERGDCDVREIIALLTCFNTAAYPNSGSNHPVVAYDNKSVVLRTFEEDHKKDGGRAYLRLRPLLKDILTLHDTIQIEFPKLHEQAARREPALIESATKKPFKFPFLQTHSTERLTRGALYPMLAAFRWMVEGDPRDGSARWRGGFDAVLERWRAAGERLVAQSVEKCAEAQGSTDAIGKSSSHWGALHKEIAFLDLMATPAPPQTPTPGGTAASDSATSAA